MIAAAHAALGHAEQARAAFETAESRCRKWEGTREHTAFRRLATDAMGITK